MIRINNKDIIEIYLGSKTINAIYKEDKLVWSKIKEIISCYSNGYWIDEYPWIDDTPWID